MPTSMRTAGRYELIRQVGHGGMAVVYLARQTDLDRFVALKELRLLQAPDQGMAQRFLREARLAGSLSHPNIVTVHEHFEFDGTPFISMEYLERGSLRPYVGRMTLPQIAGVLEGLLAGLDHASHHDIVHRDLKPENLMVTREGRIKIADFGIARARNRLQTGAFMTATGTTVGTPTYMAPEQAMAKDIGAHTDLYSVGVMAYELLVGKVPFHDTETPVAILLKHINEEIPSAITVNPEIDPGLSAWVDRLLEKDWKQRIATPSEAWDELEDLVIGLLGSRWRREARLPEIMPQGGSDRPLTPAHFTATASTPTPAPGAAAASTDGSSGFESFAWGARAGAPPAADASTAVEAPGAAPSHGAAPLAPAVEPTAAPDAVVPAPAPTAAPEAVVPAPEAVAAPAPVPPTGESTPPEPVSASGDEEESGFLTFGPTPSAKPAGAGGAAAAEPAETEPTGGAEPAETEPTGGAEPAETEPTGGAEPAETEPTGRAEAVSPEETAGFETFAVRPAVDAGHAAPRVAVRLCLLRRRALQGLSLRSLRRRSLPDGSSCWVRRPGSLADVRAQRAGRGARRGTACSGRHARVGGDDRGRGTGWLRRAACARRRGCGNRDAGLDPGAPARDTQARA